MEQIELVIRLPKELNDKSFAYLIEEEKQTILNAVDNGIPLPKEREDKKEEKTRKVAGKRYTPVCPRGYDDCVWDPAYIQYCYPDWYKKLYGDKTPTEAIAEENDCLDKVEEDPDEEFYCYDDEDK